MPDFFSRVNALFPYNHQKHAHYMMLHITRV